MKFKRSIKLLSILVFVITLFSVLYFKTDTIRNYFINEEPKTNIVEEPKEVWPKVNSLSLVAAGDALAHGSFFSNSFYKTKDGGFDYSSIYTLLEDFIPNYDLAYYNQETVFAGKSFGYSNFPAFNTPHEFGEALLGAGFNLVSLATNHSMDKGSKGAYNSALWWESQEGIYATGMATSEEIRSNIKIEEINGITYAMLSYSYSAPAPQSQKYLANQYSDELAKADIEAVRDKVDLLIVAMHWGVEYAHQPNATQKRQAEYLSSLGVDLILGNHSHCIQTIDFINDTLVIYSMGNLISHQMADRMLVGGINPANGTWTAKRGMKIAIGAFVMMDINKIIEKDGSFKIEFDNIEVLLHYSSYIEGQHMVVPFNKIDEDYLPHYMKQPFLNRFKPENYKDYKDVFYDFKPIMEHERVTVIDPFQTEAVEN